MVSVGLIQDLIEKKPLYVDVVWDHKDGHTHYLLKLAERANFQ